MDDNTNNFFPVPSEVYLFSFTEEDIKKLHKRSISSVLKRFLLLLFILVVFASGEIIAPNSREIYGFLYGLITFTVLLLITSLIRIVKVQNYNIKKITQVAYEYRVFRDYFEIFIIRNGECVRSQKIYYYEIEKISSADGFISIQTGGQVFLLKENELLPQSTFFMFIQNNTAKAQIVKPTDIYTVLSVVLFVASILSLFGAVSLTGFLMEKNGFSNTNMWGFFAMLPIPVFSVIFGFILKSKGYKYKKNIIIGCIIGAYLTAFGCFVFIPTPQYSEEEMMLSSVENIVDIDLPEALSIRVFDYSNNNTTTKNDDINYQINASFSEENAVILEKEIFFDNRWMTFIPYELNEINIGFGGQNFHNTLIYNIDTGEYNCLPEKSGTYSFIALGYWQDTNQLRIAQYEVNYIK